MRETFSLLGRRRTILDLSPAAEGMRPPARLARGREGEMGASTLPLRWLVADGVLVTLPNAGDDAVQLASCQAQLAATNPVRPLEIVLCRLPLDTAPAPNAGLAGACLDWLLEQGVRVIGVSAREPGPRAAWSSVQARSGVRYCLLEGLRHLDRLPGPRGFTVLVLPAHEADPALSRVLAVFDGV